MDDPALSTLLLPFESGELAWPERGPVPFLRARMGTALASGPLAERARATLACRQSWRPDVERLEAAGYAVAADAPEEEPGGAPLVLLLAPRQRLEARALLARAVAAAAPGGLVVVALANLEGARSLEGDLAALIGPPESRSKHKCRVFWGRVEAARLDAALAAEWAALDRPRPEAESGLLTRPGLFAWDRVDAGSALLAAQLPAALAGRAADLGAGVGYLSAALLRRCPGLESLDLYEAEKRALDLARQNLAGRQASVALDFLWHDVTRGLPRRYDTIVSNPPFHRGRQARSDLGQAFIAAAAAALAPGGSFWLVANRHLPYETALREGFAELRTAADEGGYKVIEARAARAGSTGRRRS